VSDFNETNPVSVGDATKKDHYDRVFDNALALRRVAARSAGGDWEFRQTDAAFTKIAGHRVVEIDGDEVGAIDVHFMAKVDAGTGQVRLFNITTASGVGSAVNVTATTDMLGTITGLTAAAGVNQYRVEALKGTTWITVWGAEILLAQ
jgi:hypothetical protein